MTIISKSNMKEEEIEVTKKALLEILDELYKDCVIHCHHIPRLDQFFVICYVNIHDDDAYFTMNFDYDEALQSISDAI